MQHRAALLAILARFLLIGVQQQVQEGAVDTAGGFDDPGGEAFLRYRIGIAQILAAELTVAREVPVLPPVDAFPLLPAQNGLVFDVERLLRVVRQFIGAVRAQAQAILMVDDAFVPLEAPLLPVVEPLLHLAGMHEELQIPLLELALPEQEVARRHLVAEGFTDLADTERNLHARGLQHVVVVQVDVLACLTAQVGLHALALDDTDVGLHHQVKRARLHQFAAAVGTPVLQQVLFRQMVDAETPLAVFAFYEAVDKILDVAAGLPDAGVRDDGALDTHDVIVQLHHRPPPVAADVVAQFDAERAEVIDARNAAVDF